MLLGASCSARCVCTLHVVCCIAVTTVCCSLGFRWRCRASGCGTELNAQVDGRDELHGEHQVVIPAVSSETHSEQSRVADRSSTKRPHRRSLPRRALHRCVLLHGRTNVHERLGARPRRHASHTRHRIGCQTLPVLLRPLRRRDRARPATGNPPGSTRRAHPSRHAGSGGRMVGQAERCHAAAQDPCTCGASEPYGAGSRHAANSDGEGPLHVRFTHAVDLHRVHHCFAVAAPNAWHAVVADRACLRHQSGLS